MKTLLGSEGGQERVILCVGKRGYYLAIKFRNRYRRTFGGWLMPL